MKGDKLTLKQEKFINNLIEGKSQREAYKLSYNAENMQDSTIDCNASNLFKNNKVATRYQELLSKLTKEAEEESITNAKEILRNLNKIATSDIKDYLSFYMGERVIGVDDNGEPITNPCQMIDIKDSNEVDGSLIQEVSISAKGVFTFKLCDKMKALELMGKHIGMFTDKVESKVDTDMKITIEYVDK